ncbi:MAG: beta-ketoacyl-[acyl-carrier-protein] synthase family protein [Syntrophales bacterium]|nr:beta-ketoacyl-[acyl-carrier-protein] synthase family protein [Syntrophales bacterium]
MKRRVVITSIGVVSSLGCTPDEIIMSLKGRKVAFERQASDGEVVVAPVRNFNIRSYTGPFKDGRYLNRGAQFSVASAIDAVRNSGSLKESFARAGLFVGAGPNLDIGGEFPEVTKGNIDRNDLQALWILKFLPNTAASVISQLIGIHGENLTVSTACSSSLQAIGEAYRKIKDGYLNCALAGGGDSRLSSGGILAYKKAKALCIGSGKPEKASRPFDCGRNGFVPGEGGAFFLLEELEQAKKQGSEIYAELCGYGCSLDAHNMTAPEKSGRSAKDAMNAALKEAEVSPSQIDAVSAHGTGTVLNDEMEANIIFEIYGKAQPSVIALKSWIGHAASACGALELAITLACMRDGYLPEIRNLDEPCHGEVKFVRSGMSAPFGTAVIENFGFGGQNSALVVKSVY